MGELKAGADSERWKNHQPAKQAITRNAPSLSLFIQPYLDCGFRVAKYCSSSSSCNVDIRVGESGVSLMNLLDAPSPEAMLVNGLGSILMLELPPIAMLEPFHSELSHGPSSCQTIYINSSDGGVKVTSKAS